MSKFIVQGGVSLKGKVRIQGSKNAAFPIIAAALLAAAPSEIRNVPDIGDVHSALAILKHLGAVFRFEDHILKIDPRGIKNRALPRPIMGKFRGSVVFAGAFLSRFGQVRFAFPGGDMIGARPIDVHLEGFRKLGAKVGAGRGGAVASARVLRGAKIVLGVTSVTGTENIILASALARGITEIKLAATEPHVQDLCRFLNKMGADIRGIGTPSVRVRGVKKLRGVRHTLQGDEIAAMTYAAAAAATRGHVTISGIAVDTLEAPLSVLERMGVHFSAAHSSLTVGPPKQDLRAARIVTGVYPQLLTDMQPLLGVLATQASGTTTIHDWIYEGRQGYLKELERMGALVEFSDIHRASITGPTALRGGEIRTPDIRAGASILIAALIAKGRTVIYNAEIIDRGYEKIDERLRALGANIERVS